MDDTIEKLSSSETSFGIRGGPLENSFGFRLNLENFQCAKSNIEVSILKIYIYNKEIRLEAPIFRN